MAATVHRRPPYRRAGGISLAEKVRFLSRAASYAERPQGVRAIETHMSWVFLTDKHAYKLKKPVKQTFLDFSTIEARRRNCRAEVRLNNRLAPGIYLGVVPLVLRAHRTLSLGGAGRVVDWLVQMRRLRKSDVLQEQIKRHRLRGGALSVAVAALVRFYEASSPILIDPAHYRRRFESEIRGCCHELARPIWRLPGNLVREAAVAQLDFIRREPWLLDDRVRSKRIVEGHGDLRPEHVYLGPVPVITDCLEFDRALRILDPTDEVAYLALECEMLGAPEVGRSILAIYVKRSHDRVPERLLHFYMSVRACMRARLAIWHLRDARVSQPRKWRRRALKYLHLATQHAGALGTHGRTDRTQRTSKPAGARPTSLRREAA
jgi:aminoglycoside phosphotransferase family enzyme